jgi:cell division protein FtsB
VSKKVVIFISLLIVLVGITTFNILGSQSNRGSAEISQIQSENQELKRIIDMLEEEVARTQPEAIAEERETIIEVAREFVHLAYDRTFEDYEEERARAREIMNTELFERFFPANTLEANEHLETDVTIKHLYLEDKGPTEDTLYAIAHFHHFINDTEIDRQEERELHVALTIKNDEEKGWIITHLQTITSVVIED